MMVRTLLVGVTGVLIAWTTAMGGEHDADPGASAGQRLRAIIGDYWAGMLKAHPLEAAVFVGDHRYGDRVDDPSPTGFDRFISLLETTQGALKAIDPASLNADERLDREILLASINNRLEAKRFGDHLIPLGPILRYASDLHFPDLHLLFAQIGEFQPSTTHGDLENYLLRLKAFPRVADGILETLRKGMAEKRMPPRVVVPKVVAQLRSLGQARAEESPFWAIVPRLPDDWPDADKSRIKERIKQAIETDVAPAYLRLADFVETTYLPACPDRISLSESADGPEHYAFLVRHYTTTDLTPDQIHEMGLAEMAKTRAAMDAVRTQVGFEGDLKAFFAQMRTDPQFKNQSAEQILDGHRAIIATMEANLPRLFGRLPRIPLEVRAFEPIRAKSSPTGEYYPAASDGSRPGIFFVNTSDPSSRPTYTMQTLAYHEAIPGHHLQGAIGLEAPGRPPFRRYFYFPAFDEGWALYCESLPAEIGLYTEPYAVFGRLNYDSLRCARLVVDTGMHHKGWSRDQAIDYMEQNSSLPRNEIENEIDRYIAWPGQALAYKVGELKIREIRAKLAQREGAGFDLRSFHDELLSFGSAPLWLVERLMLAGK